MTEDEREIGRAVRDVFADYLLALEASTYGTMCELISDVIDDLKKLEKKASALVPDDYWEKL